MKNRQNYVPAERQEKILQYIEAHGSGQISALSKWMDVSEATIRRDLDFLHQAGNLERTHGGAVCTRSGSAYERQYEERLTLMEAEKRHIVSATLEQISPGDTIFLDSGTTCYYLGCALSKIPNLTVFTYDLMVAYYASLHPTSELIVTGGVRRHGFSNVLLGNQIIRLLQGLRIDKVFLGADAVDIDFGVSNSTLQEAEIKTEAISRGNQVFLLADHTKFGKVALAKVCGLEQIDVFITDSEIDPNYLEKLQMMGRQVILA